MQMDFHYYATFCAAYLAGFSHEESLEISYSAQLVDLCSKTFLSKINAPAEAATTQLQLEMMDAREDIFALPEITSIWAPFHFLPYDLNAKLKWRPRGYMNKYRLICGPNGELVHDMIEAARGRSLQHVGIVMHVLADTWAHRYFAGTPSLVINNTTNDFYEIRTGMEDQKIRFRHSPSAADDPEHYLYTNSVYTNNEHSVMNLGHGRAGHLPDYSFITYRYMPAWGQYKVIVKNNPDDYRHAFCQMIYAMKVLKSAGEPFEVNRYDFDAIAPYENRIHEILTKRQLIACEDWKAFGEELSGQAIPDFDRDQYVPVYEEAPDDQKAQTFLGRFTDAAMKHKSMVCEKIFRSGNLLTGLGSL